MNNTVEKNLNPSGELWIFGYGSLIWRPDFDFVEKQRATLPGWCRRFWQGSHDHRGTVDKPGRVVTLIAEADAVCEGMAFRLSVDNRDDILAALDYREKNGYERLLAPLQLFDNRGNQTTVVTGLTYIASPDNVAFLGPGTTKEMVSQIASSHGPSGSNRDYLLELAQAFRELAIVDEHVMELERLLLELSPSAQ